MTHTWIAEPRVRCVAALPLKSLTAAACQSYSMNALGFSIKRAGILYGTVDEEGNVKVDAVYEPPQQGTADTVVMERETDEERRAEEIANYLG